MYHEEVEGVWVPGADVSVADCGGAADQVDPGEDVVQ